MQRPVCVRLQNCRNRTHGRIVSSQFTALAKLRKARLDQAGEAQYSGSMPMTIEQIAAEALALPSEARALLADRLVESLDTAEANRIDKLWATAAKRRRDEVRQGLVQTIPGDEALARVRRSLGR